MGGTNGIEVFPTGRLVFVLWCAGLRDCRQWGYVSPFTADRDAEWQFGLVSSRASMRLVHPNLNSCGGGVWQKSISVKRRWKCEQETGRCVRR